MVQIKFIALGANSAIGAFQPGDTLRCSEAMARHLIEESGVAQYVEGTTPPGAQAVQSLRSNVEARPATRRKPRRSEAAAEAAGGDSRPEAGEGANAGPDAETQPAGSVDAVPSAEVTASTQAAGDSAEA